MLPAHLRKKTMRYSAVPPLNLAIAVAVLCGTTPFARAADEPVMLISRLYATPGREAELEGRILKSVEFVRKMEPTTIIRAYRSSRDPSVFGFYEIFSSQAAHDQHNGVTNPARVKAMGPSPEGLLARPPELEAFRPLDN